MSLVLPWEVLERVIDHSSGSAVTLYSFTISCRQLNPRSTMLLLRRIVLKNRDQLFSLCDVLRSKPHLQPVVRSITVPPNEFSPHPILRMLCNLSEIEFTTAHAPLMAYPVVIHTCVLKYCRQFGDHVQSLSLERIDLPSLYVFSEILLSFRRIRSLSCSQMKVLRDDINQGLMSRRLSERLLLETLSVSVYRNPSTVFRVADTEPSPLDRRCELRFGQRAHVARENSRAHRHKPHPYEPGRGRELLLVFLVPVSTASGLGN